VHVFFTPNGQTDDYLRLWHCVKVSCIKARLNTRY